MRQVETSATLVFDDPRRARAIFEALVCDNVGIGRAEVAMVFSRPLRWPTNHLYRHRIFGAGTEARMDFTYKHFRVKQNLKEGRARRIETVINDPRDLDIARRLEHLPELQDKARCASETYALAGALCVMVHAVSGFTNKSLRSLVAGLLGGDYSAQQMTYDLRRLRLHGLVERIPSTNTYVTTSAGLRAAISSTKVYDRVLAPLLSPDKRPAPHELRKFVKRSTVSLNACCTTR